MDVIIRTLKDVTVSGTIAVPVAKRGGNICQSHHYSAEKKKILEFFEYAICILPTSDMYP